MLTPVKMRFDYTQYTAAGEVAAQARVLGQAVSNGCTTEVTERLIIVDHCITLLKKK
jgi:hypothetical protein